MAWAGALDGNELARGRHLINRPSDQRVTNLSFGICKRITLVTELASDGDLAVVIT